VPSITDGVTKPKAVGEIFVFYAFSTGLFRSFSLTSEINSLTFSLRVIDFICFPLGILEFFADY